MIYEQPSLGTKDNAQREDDGAWQATMLYPCHCLVFAQIPICETRLRPASQNPMYPEYPLCDSVVEYMMSGEAERELMWVYTCLMWLGQKSGCYANKYTGQTKLLTSYILFLLRPRNLVKELSNMGITPWFNRTYICVYAIPALMLLRYTMYTYHTIECFPASAFPVLQWHLGLLVSMHWSTTQNWSWHSSRISYTPGPWEATQMKGLYLMLVTHQGL